MARTELYDVDESLKDSTWSKALTRYRAKGMSEKEIGEHRKAYQDRMKSVNSVSSKSKK